MMGKYEGTGSKDGTMGVSAWRWSGIYEHIVVFLLPAQSDSDGHALWVLL